MNKAEIIERYGIEEYQRRLDNCKKRHLLNKERDNEKQRQYYQANKELFTEYKKNNKEHITEYNKLYREKNKEYFVKYKKLYRENNKDYISKYQKQYHNTISGKAVLIYHNCKKYDDARFGNDSCDLTIDWIIENIVNATHCHYCGCELDFENLSIDRKNSDLPHTKDNCVASCFNCNHSKNNTPYDEFIIKIKGNQ